MQTGLRAAPKLLLLAGLGAAASAPAPAHAELVVKRMGSGFSAQVADSLVKALQASPSAVPVRVIELTGDWNTDLARVARSSEGQTTVFAIGPDAAVVAGQTKGTNVVALAVPNPARLGISATYVSMYPRPERVFKLLAKSLNARKVGFLFSPRQNTEVATTFADAARSQGLTLVPIAVGSPGELVRELREALPGVDALVLPVDPILFDRQSLQTIVEESTKLKRPTVGFLDALLGLGVTACLVTPAAAVATAAIDAARGAAPGSGGRVELDSPVLIVSRRSAEAIGLKPEAMGAQKIE